MVWKVFLGVLGALVAFSVIVLVVMGSVESAAQQDLQKQLQDYKRTSAAQNEAFQRQREVRQYQDAMRRSVCRNGHAYVPRQQGRVTYYDPVTWHGQVSACR